MYTQDTIKINYINCDDTQLDTLDKLDFKNLKSKRKVFIIPLDLKYRIKHRFYKDDNKTYKINK